MPPVPCLHPDFCDKVQAFLADLAEHDVPPKVLLMLKTDALEAAAWRLGIFVTRIYAASGGDRDELLAMLREHLDAQRRLKPSIRAGVGVVKILKILKTLEAPAHQPDRYASMCLTGEPLDIPGDWQARMLKHVNSLRRKLKICKVTYDDHLALIAQYYAERMLEGGFFGHHDPNDGGSVGDRARACKYPFKAICENLAKGQLSYSIAFKGWEKSPGHYDNMVCPRVDRAGFGVTISTDRPGVVYWVQVFAKRA